MEKKNAVALGLGLIAIVGIAYGVFRKKEKGEREQGKIVLKEEEKYW